MKIADLLNAVIDLKKKGIKSIDVEKLEDALKQTNSTETNQADWNLKVAELQHQSKLAHYDATQEMSRRSFDAAIGFATAALKSALLINGGAAVAILAYLGNQHDKILRAFPNALWWFTMGVLSSAVATGAAYLTQILYAEREDNIWGNAVRIIAALLVVTAYVSFALGSYSAYSGFSR